MLREPMPCAVVTGAASGIGRATVKRLIAQGHRVACMDRDAEALGALGREVGDTHLTLAVDIRDEDAIRRAFTRVARWSESGIGALAACAGIVDTTPFDDIGVSSFERTLSVNLTGTFVCIQEAARQMSAGGKICAVSSVAALRGGGIAGTAAYAASKAGVIALVKTVARELGPRGIHVNVVAPAVIRTPMLTDTTSQPGHIERVQAMTALRREGTAEEAANAIVWLLSPQASFITGVILPVDGGLSMY